MQLFVEGKTDYLEKAELETMRAKEEIAFEEKKAQEINLD